MKLEVGKLYRTRDGRLAYINGLNREATYPFKGIILCHSTDTVTYARNGTFDETRETHLDIVAEVPIEIPPLPFDIKPGQDVLGRWSTRGRWKLMRYSGIDGSYFVCESRAEDLIPYVGNEELIGTTRNPDYFWTIVGGKPVYKGGIK